MAHGGPRLGPTLLPYRTCPQPPKCSWIALGDPGTWSREQPSRRRDVPGPRCLATARYNPGNCFPVSAKARVSTASAPWPREWVGEAQGSASLLPCHLLPPGRGTNVWPQSSCDPGSWALPLALSAENKQGDYLDTCAQLHRRWFGTA